MIQSPHSRPWIQTTTGRRFYLDDVEENVIDIRDIATALSRIARFGGHGNAFISVAEHSVRVADACPAEFRLAGLLHDASEAYLGDVSTPLKSCDDMATYREREARLMRCIERRFRLPRGALCHDIVKTADRRALVTEAAILFARLDDGWSAWFSGYKPLDVNPATCGWEPHIAQTRFMEAYRDAIRHK